MTKVLYLRDLDLEHIMEEEWGFDIPVKDNGGALMAITTNDGLRLQWLAEDWEEIEKIGSEVGDPLTGSLFFAEVRMAENGMRELVTYLQGVSV